MNFSCFNPFLNVLEVKLMLSLFEMAIGKVFIVDIPCTLADGQFTIEARAGNFLAIHGEFITPAA